MRSVWKMRLALSCACLAAAALLTGAARPRGGREIFRNDCARCHGREGEGVKGKYDEALQGDWSVERLARHIAKSMPEDRPVKTSKPDAEAVARYIHEAFYSPEARARKYPARVQLVHLTNKQYLNTLADLLKRFSAADEEMPGEAGLRATYYHSRNFAAAKKLLERVDSKIDFDFAQHGPEGGPLGTNELSVQWRGSLVPEDTGTYEFTIKSANGFRLWVNDQEQPLIDGWVASGEMMEHHASLRLIRGRPCPVRLDFFRFKDKSAAIVLKWKPPHGTEQVIPGRNLSTRTAAPVFVARTAFPADDSSGGYERGIGISKEWDEATTRAALETAEYVAQHLDQLSKTKKADTNRLSGIEHFCAEFVTAAFRRPITPAERRLFVQAPLKSAAKLEEGVKRVVLLSLKSPRFLYLGAAPRRKADDYEAASRLAYELWDSLPDKPLMEAAAQGKLRGREEVEAQARRMLKSPKARAKISGVLEDWVQMNHVEDISKDQKLYPGFTPEIIADLRVSLTLFLEQTFWSPESDYRKLLLADQLFVNNRLASFYAISTNLNDDFVAVRVDPSRRSGVLTHPYLLAEFSYPKFSSPIHRGVFLTRKIVGRALKPPPMAVVFKDADFDPKMSMREKVAKLTESQSCQGCHSVINPLGFTLEQYDAVGRFRTIENGRAVETESDYLADDGQTVRLRGPRDVAEFAARSPQAQAAFLQHLFQQLVKQPMLAYGPETATRLREAFVNSGFNMQEMAVQIATLAALHGVEKPARSSK